MDHVWIIPLMSHGIHGPSFQSCQSQEVHSARSYNAYNQTVQTENFTSRSHGTSEWMYQNHSQIRQIRQKQGQKIDLARTNHCVAGALVGNPFTSAARHGHKMGQLSGVRPQGPMLNMYEYLWICEFSGTHVATCGNNMATSAGDPTWCSPLPEGCIWSLDKERKSATNALKTQQGKVTACMSMMYKLCNITQRGLLCGKPQGPNKAMLSKKDSPAKSSKWPGIQ